MIAPAGSGTTPSGWAIMGAMRFGVGAVLVGWTMWAICAVVLGIRVGTDAVDIQSGFACPLPGHNSEYGEASWGWWPPGKICRNHGQVFSVPQTWRAEVAAAVAAGFIILPFGTFMLARRSRVNEPTFELLEAEL